MYLPNYTPGGKIMNRIRKFLFCLCVIFFFSVPVYAISPILFDGLAGAYINWSDYNAQKEASQPDIYIEEISDTEVFVTLDLKPNTTVTYTTNGTTANSESLEYASPIKMNVGQQLRLYINNSASNFSGTMSFYIKRNETPEVRLVDDETLGKTIVMNGTEVLYKIYEGNIPNYSSQLEMKSNIDWEIYSDPIATSPLERGTCYYIFSYTPASDENISSEVSIVEYSVSEVRSCYGYIFYDKGFYSDGWRYLEINPFEYENTFGAPFIKTSATDNSLGAGFENTQKIITAIGESDIVLQRRTYAAKDAYLSESGGASDWYLPSVEEMKMAYEVYPELFKRNQYLTSTEKDSNSVQAFIVEARNKGFIKTVIGIFDGSDSDNVTRIGSVAKEQICPFFLVRRF